MESYLINKVKGWMRAKQLRLFLEIPPRLFRAIQVVQPFTLIDPLRLTMLHRLALETAQIQGDIVECGVYNGGSAAILANAIRLCQNSKIWLYDTFAGLPVAGEKDSSLAKGYEGQLQGKVEIVASVLRKVSFPLERVVFRKGLFENTFKEILPERVSLLHVDADWYESVLTSLETFYPLIPEGGIIVLDDFGHWEGAREAFYDFCKARDIKPLIERFGYTQAFWRKGQENTRSNRENYKFGGYCPEC